MRFEGDSREVALNHAAQFRQYIAANPTLPLVLFSGGETTVTVRGEGRGGPNREFLLALALELNADPSIWALAGDTDGIDGSDDDAGAVISPDTLQRAALLGLDAANALETNKVGQFFSAIDDNFKPPAQLEQMLMTLGCCYINPILDIAGFHLDSPGVVIDGKQTQQNLYTYR
ncbi:MAG: hypothetical protein CM1200mP41_22310 [Gammaproteobacteria bacterium]|nr:MAG: hypothetical protein CM1200mP41_22310 [Gammaproteobacteria bacterium]